METTPDTSSTKRARAKPKVVVKNSSAAPADVAKKPRTPRKTLTTKTAAAEIPPPADVESPSEDVGSMIATAAYYLAAARNFTPGHELEDWLEAERAVHAKLNG